VVFLFIPLIVLSIIAYCVMHGLSFSQLVDRLWDGTWGAQPIIIGVLIALWLLTAALRRRSDDPSRTDEAQQLREDDDRL